MNKREELIAKLGALRREFEGFPEEQKVFDDAVQELTKSSGAVPPIDQHVSNADLLRMARHLGKYCDERSCGECFMNGLRNSDGDRVTCVFASWLYTINDDLISRVEREELENNGGK